MPCCPYGRIWHQHEAYGEYPYEKWVSHRLRRHFYRASAAGTSVKLTEIVRAIKTPLPGKILVFLHGVSVKSSRLTGISRYGLATLTGKNPLLLYG